MRAILRRYANEIVGLFVLGLMIVALVAGETDANARLASADNAVEHTVIQIGLKVRD